MEPVKAKRWESQAELGGALKVRVPSIPKAQGQINQGEKDSEHPPHLAVLRQGEEVIALRIFDLSCHGTRSLDGNSFRPSLHRGPGNGLHASVNSRQPCRVPCNSRPTTPWHHSSSLSSSFSFP